MEMKEAGGGKEAVQYEEGSGCFICRVIAAQSFGHPQGSALCSPELCVCKAAEEQITQVLHLTPGLHCR